MTRTSTRTSCLPPSRENSPSCSTCSSLACSAGRISPISSRNIVPWFANSNLPGFCWIAPVNAPRSKPNSSDSSSSVGSAAQFTFTNGLSRRERASVDRAGDELLAGAALAADQHGDVGVRDALDQLADLGHALAVAEEHRYFDCCCELLAQRRDLARELPLLERAARAASRVRAPRTACRRSRSRRASSPARRWSCALAGDDDDGHVAIDLLERRQRGEAVHGPGSTTSSSTAAGRSA